MSDSSSFVPDDSCSDDVQSAKKLFNQISRTIARAKMHQLLTYEGIDPKTGSLVVELLDQDKKVENVGHR